MAEYTRVSLSEKDMSIAQNAELKDTKEDVRQANNFDNNYTDKKLNDLYKEFDSITINDTDLTHETIVNNKAKAHMSAKVKIRLTAGMLIAAMLLVLAIYNIFVINNLNSSIKIINSDITAEQYSLNNAEARYSELTNTDGVEVELEAQGYSSLDDMTKVKVTIPSAEVSQTVEVPTNWWDKFCNFIANMFGSN